MKYLIILLFILSACSDDPEPKGCGELKEDAEKAWRMHREYKARNGIDNEEKRLYDIWYQKSMLVNERRCP
jgi:hypothetical protein